MTVILALKVVLLWAPIGQIVSAPVFPVIKLCHSMGCDGAVLRFKPLGVAMRIKPRMAIQRRRPKVAIQERSKTAMIWSGWRGIQIHVDARALWGIVLQS